MANYRMIAQVERADDLERRLSEQVYAWVRSKRLPADRMEPGKVVDLGGAQAIWLVESHVDGSTTSRFRLREASGWLTTLTADLPRVDRWERAQVWLDVDGPREQAFSAVPGLARNILGTVDGFDSLARLSDAPILLRVDEVDHLIDVLCDPDRRGMTFVAGSERSLPFDPWRQLVAQVLKETVGSASAYVLDPDATGRLAEQLGERHSVPPGTIRTYRPGLDPASYVDARRHRILGAERLVTDQAPRLARVMSKAARDQQSAAPLPRHLMRLATRWAKSENELLAASSREAVAGKVGSATADWTESLIAGLRDLLGERLRAASVRSLLSLARYGRDARERLLPDLKARMDELTTELERVTEDRDERIVQVEDLELELAEEAERSRKNADLVRHLQRSLERSGQAEVAWSEVPDSERSAVPESYEALLGAIESLPRVRFTGDPEDVLALQEHDPMGNWARKMWEALLALEGYAEAKRDGLAGNFGSYLASPDHDYPKVAAKRYKPAESESVANRWRSEREFPVPETVADGGRVYMEAHIAIVAKRSTSPRLYFHDATGCDGNVYVGYLGRHLTNTLT